MDDQQFRRLLEYLGLTWTGYRKIRKGVKKRIRRHMRKLNVADIKGYLDELDKNRDARNECELLMTVSISRFFRDRRLWELLRKEIFPELIKDYIEKISVWSAGCASGEEVYSLKILWDELTSTIKEYPGLAITATDMNPIYLERARAGIYLASSLKELPELFISTYFQPIAVGRNQYIIKDSLKKNISWQEHNLLSDFPLSQFQIIFLRNNLLTYYQEDIKKAVFENILKSLYPGGFLIIGANEKLPSKITELNYCSSLPYVFKKDVRVNRRLNGNLSILR